MLVVKPKLQAAFADIIGIFEILGSFMIGAVSYSSVQASFGSKTEEISRVNEQTSAGTENLNADATQTSSKQTISNLARQLAASASRAEARDKTLNRSELADKAKNLLGQISGDSYQANKKIHDGEVPKTSDPELLARAKQATEFINRSSNTGNEKNPFSGLSRDQLSNIVYDESGTYTVNERRAAWMESSKQEEVWREKVIAQAIAEYNESGKLTNFFSSVLDHFKELPAIEQAQYPKDYVSDLESKIKLDFNYRTHQAEGKGEDPVSLIETLFAQTGGTMASKVTSAVEQTSDTSPNQGASSGMQTISTLARQLAASTSRAEERDRTLTRSELADKAKSILNQTVGDAYYANKARHDSEVPKTGDPELLARAKQATAFVNDAARGGNAIKNPFSGLSREQLSNIIYDDSGTYTVNERHAAWRESYDQEEAWREKVAAKAMAEYNSTGKLTNFFSSVLDHFKELPAIEQAQYPQDYASDLGSKISWDFNYRTHQAEGKGEDPKSLIEMLLSSNPEVAKQSDSLLPAAQSNKSTAAGVGRALMLSRLFGTENNGVEPPVISGVNGMDLNHIGMSPLNFLTTSDRALLSDMYDYAHQQSADLQNVDHLAFALGNYRQSNNGRAIYNFNNGNNFDFEGHLRTVSFNEKDTATASRILNSDAINSTRLDQGFLRYTLDPGNGALSNTSDFEFMEQMVIKFSDTGAEQISLPSKFSSFSGRSPSESSVFTLSKEVLNPNPASTFKPQIINDNGKWIVLDPAALGGNSLEQTVAQQKIKSAVSLNEQVISAFFGNDKGISEVSTSSGLLSLLGKVGKAKVL